MKTLNIVILMVFIYLSQYLNKLNNKDMKKICFLMSLLLITSAFANDDIETFNQLKNLAGKWVGTLNGSDGNSKTINLSYSIKSNGSALLEESNEAGVEMMTIFNLHNDKILSTHYCGAMNRPVSELHENDKGKITFITDQSRSGLDKKKDFFVESWKFNLMPENEDTFIYSYVVNTAGGKDIIQTAEMKRVK